MCVKSRRDKSKLMNKHSPKRSADNAAKSRSNGIWRKFSCFLGLIASSDGDALTSLSSEELETQKKIILKFSAALLV